MSNHFNFLIVAGNAAVFQSTPIDVWGVELVSLPADVALQSLVVWKSGGLEASGPGASVPDVSPMDDACMDVRDLVGERFTFYFDI